MLTAALALRDGAGDGLASIQPNHVGLIDPTTNEIVAEVPVGIRPGPIAAGAGSIWVGNLDDRTLTRIDVAQRAAAAVVRGRRIASNVRLAMVVPGSGPVKEQAEREGLDRIFKEAGFEWREPGCSMCLGMNEDKLSPGERGASTSNRNFEGRQGPGGRTHLVSPEMAAAAAVSGHFVDVRSWS